MNYKLSDTFKETSKLFAEVFKEYQNDDTVKNGAVITVDFKAKKVIKISKRRYKLSEHQLNKVG